MVCAGAGTGAHYGVKTGGIAALLNRRQQKKAENVLAGLYARVSTNDQQTIPHGDSRHARVRCEARLERQPREQLLDAARRREIDVVLVWRLDRWGRSLQL